MSPSNRKWLRSPSERVGTLSHADLPPPAAVEVDEEQALLLALRDGDEAAFEWLLNRYYTPMLRVARTYVRSREEAEEVVQDSWLAVLSGIGRFEGRSSLKTWIFRILVNRARSRAKREARQVPFSSLRESWDSSSSEGSGSPADWLVHAGGSSGSSWSGQAWAPLDPEEAVLASELNQVIESAIAKLPPRQQIVINLRDIEGWSAAEVCDLLEVSEANQRVLLHRGRLKVRDALDPYFGPAAEADPAMSPRSAG